MIIQVDLKDLENYFFFFTMNKNQNRGTWLSPIGDMEQYWQYCFEVIIYSNYAAPTSTYERYDGTQEKIDYKCDKQDVLLNFEFPDEETALYFSLKFKVL